MPNVFCPSPTRPGVFFKPTGSFAARSNGGTFTKPVYGSRAQPDRADWVPLVFVGTIVVSGHGATIKAFASVSVAGPLARRIVASSPAFPAPFLPRGMMARRVSGLIWPRQFIGARPENGILIPRTMIYGPAAPEEDADEIYFTWPKFGREF